MRRTIALLPFAIAACVPAAKPPAPPPPATAPRVAEPAPVPAPALGPDWRDWPLTPGTWRYAAGVASFGAPGSEPRLALRCDADQRRMLLSIAGAGPEATIRTTSTIRRLALQPAPGAQPSAAAALPATDPLLDALAFSRGRFTVERPGQAPLVVPAYSEVGRVVEDCRR